MSSKTYKIHDNGGRPFHVTVTGKKVVVEKNMDTYDFEDGKFITIQAPLKHLFEKTVDEIFLGKKSPKGGYDGLKPSQAEGNSILLRDGAKYIYIGSEIYEFTPRKGDTIETYYSDIGNNDVPYPYAIGKTYVYLLLDKVAVKKSFFNMKENIYSQYYDQDLKEKGEKFRTKLLQKRL